MLTNCPVCFSSHLNSNLDHYPMRNAKSFYEKIVNCNSCKSGTALPYLNQDQLNDFYSSGVYWGNVSSDNLNIHTLTQCRFRVSLILKCHHDLPESFRVLDVGAGHGHIVEAFRGGNSKLSFHYDFIEPDQQLSNSILNKFSNITTKIGHEDLLTTYDFIFLNHVLEHTADPCETLKRFTNKINKNGMIYIEVPHRDDRTKDNVFPHSIFFSKEGLLRLIERANLNCIQLDCFGSIDSIKAPSSFFKRIRIKILNKLFSIFVKYGPTKLAEVVDSFIFGYNNKNENGIWIRAICVAK